MIEVLPSAPAQMDMPSVGSNCQIIVEEADGVKEVHLNVEAEPGVTGFMVEKALKEALGFSPRGDVYRIGGAAQDEGEGAEGVL
ncbi:MAG: hypothetical protein ACP5OU_10065 [Methanothrix sp.]